MFDIGWAELLVIGSIALIVVGPKDLPRMMRVVGRYMAQARGMARDFQRSMEEAAREADIADMKEMKDVAGQLRDIRSAAARPVLSPKQPGIAPATAGAGLAGTPGAAARPQAPAGGDAAGPAAAGGPDGAAPAPEARSGTEG